MTVEKVYIIGTGMLAINCAQYAKEQGLPVILFDMGKKNSIMLEKQARLKKVPYFHKNPGEVFTLLCDEQKNILLVSAINGVIVPGKVLEKKSITAINLHQALLPAHPGRNTEAWAIFEQDDVSGITWHIMEPKVDNGEILVQKVIPLDNTTTSFSLFHQQILCAFDVFKELFESLINGTYKSIPQKRSTCAVFHFNKDIPNEGWLKLEWSAAKISAFLRAMDYGVLKILKPPRIYLNGQVYEWKKYEIHSSVTRKEQGVTVKENGNIDITIRKEHMEIILRNCKHKEEKNMDKLLKILKELRPEVDFETEKKLIDEGILDSFDMVSLIGEINDVFHIDIDFEDIEPENFNSAQGMYALIYRLQKEV